MRDMLLHAVRNASAAYIHSNEQFACNEYIYQKASFCKIKGEAHTDSHLHL